MAFSFRDDIALADVAIEAWGATREELFRECAAALLATMTAKPASVERREELTVALADPELDLLLFAFLQELVYLKDARRLLLHADAATITETAVGFALQARLAGERIDPPRHALLVDVKAVTLHRFRLEPLPDGWGATVVLDV